MGDLRARELTVCPAIQRNHWSPATSRHQKMTSPVAIKNPTYWMATYQTVVTTFDQGDCRQINFECVLTLPATCFDRDVIGYHIPYSRICLWENRFGFHVRS